MWRKYTAFLNRLDLRNNCRLDSFFCKSSLLVTDRDGVICLVNKCHCTCSFVLGTDNVAHIVAGFQIFYWQHFQLATMESTRISLLILQKKIQVKVAMPLERFLTRGEVGSGSRFLSVEKIWRCGYYPARQWRSQRRLADRESVSNSLLNNWSKKEQNQRWLNKLTNEQSPFYYLKRSVR